MSRGGSSPARARRPPSPNGAELRMKQLRARIDALDDQLVKLLNRRAACAVEIGHLKKALGLDIYQPERELAVLRHVREATKGPLQDEAMTRLFERIIDEARRLERLAPDDEKEP
jgi:chorismate mutase